jgi:hypothetical protein
MRIRTLGINTAMKKSPQKGMSFGGIDSLNQAINNVILGKNSDRTRNQVAISIVLHSE